MKKVILLFSLLLVSQAIYAQVYNCGWFGTMNATKRLQQFPFNKAKKVVLISFPGNIESALNDKSDNKYLRIDTIALNKDKHQRVYKVIEEKEIFSKDIDSISNVLFNFKAQKVKKGSLTGSLCYDPRNAIVFYDENNSIICFYEICFECHGAYIFPENEKVNMLNYIDADCTERIDYLKQIFIRNNISYGVKN